MLALLICIILRRRNFCGADVFLRFFNPEFELFGGGCDGLPPYVSIWSDMLRAAAEVFFGTNTVFGTNT